MGQKTVRFSDLSGQLIMRDDVLARIVIQEHPDLGDGPVEIETLADEALAMEKETLRVAVLDVYLPGGGAPRRGGGGAGRGGAPRGRARWGGRSGSGKCCRRPGRSGGPGARVWRSLLSNVRAEVAVPLATGPQGHDRQQGQQGDADQDVGVARQV